MTDPVARAGQDFLTALTAYLREKLKNPQTSMDQHEQRYRIFLEALGFKQKPELLEALMMHMQQMKGSGGVRKEPPG